jgi:hypothetical protein
MSATHAALGREVRVDLPVRWHRRDDPGHGVLVAARPRLVPASGYCPEVVVRCAAVSEGLASWRAEALDALAAQLPDFALEDEDDYELGDQPVAYRRFAHRVGSADLLSEQWAWQVDGLGVTLTCSVAREDYPTFCDVFEEIAATLEVLPAAA